MLMINRLFSQCESDKKELQITLTFSLKGLKRKNERGYMINIIINTSVPYDLIRTY